MVLACALNAQTTTTRDLSEFLNVQGTVMIPGYPGPVAGFFSWTDLTGRNMSVDYAGLVKRCWPTLNLPTSSDGVIIERPLPDGRAEVTVILHTQNAVTFVAEQDPAFGTILFGQRWSTSGTCGVASTSGLDNPVLGDLFMQLVFINTAPGAPLPDLFQLFGVVPPAFGQEPRTLKVSAKAVGPLYNLPRIADGTIGRASTQQVGLLYKYGTHGKPAIDGFTVERVDLKPTGK
jgi:hypothetical protein